MSILSIQEQITNIVDIDKIVQNLKKEGITDSNIQSIIDIKNKLPQLSTLYKYLSDIEYNNQIDKDIAFNEQQKVLKQKLSSLEADLNAEYYMREIHMQWLDYYYYINKQYELIPQLDEVHRQLQYYRLHKKYKDTQTAYYQNQLYLYKQKEDYNELQKILSNMKYYNVHYNKELMASKDFLSKSNYYIIKRMDLLTEERESLKKQIEANKILSNLSELKDTLKVKTGYQDLLVKNGGIKNHIIEKYLTYIQDHINNYLTTFYISLSLSGNEIAMIINKEGQTLHTQQLSGYESFQLDIVSKVVLNTLSSVGTSTFLSIDEGFDVIDNTNLDLFIEFLQSLQTRYNQIFLISHTSSIKDISSRVITPQNI